MTETEWLLRMGGIPETLKPKMNSLHLNRVGLESSVPPVDVSGIDISSYVFVFFGSRKTRMQTKDAAGTLPHQNTVCPSSTTVVVRPTSS